MEKNPLNYEKTIEDFKKDGQLDANKLLESSHKSLLSASDQFLIGVKKAFALLSVFITFFRTQKKINAEFAKRLENLEKSRQNDA